VAEVEVRQVKETAPKLHPHFKKALVGARRIRSLHLSLFFTEMAIAVGLFPCSAEQKGHLCTEKIHDLALLEVPVTTKTVPSLFLAPV
jgi:hypothetical protein